MRLYNRVAFWIYAVYLLSIAAAVLLTIAFTHPGVLTDSKGFEIRVKNGVFDITPPADNQTVTISPSTRFE